MSNPVQIGRTVMITPKLQSTIHAAAKAAGGWKPLARVLEMAPGHLHEIGHGKQKSITLTLFNRIFTPLEKLASSDVPSNPPLKKINLFCTKTTKASSNVCTDRQVPSSFFKSLSDLATHPDLKTGIFRNISSVTITFHQ